MKQEKKRLGRRPEFSEGMYDSITIRIPKFWRLALPENLSAAVRELLRKEYIDKIILKEKVS
jgi:hypothetical protein